VNPTTGRYRHTLHLSDFLQNNYRRGKKSEKKSACTALRDILR